MAHVNPKCFEQIHQAKIDEEKSQNGELAKPLTQGPFCSMWFIGLEFEKTENLNVDLTDSIQSFTNSVHKHAVCFYIIFLKKLHIKYNNIIFRFK